MSHESDITPSIIIVATLVLFCCTVCLFSDIGSFEKTIYIVAVDTNTPFLGWKNTAITYTDIYPNAVTELDKSYLTFYGIDYNLEAGKPYIIKYHKQWNWLYPILDEVIEINP